MKPVSRWATVVALLLVPSAVRATVVIDETIEDMARASTVVVRGRVLQVQPQLEESSGRIYTYADIQVLEVFKGAGTGSILVKSPGGEIGNRGTVVAGAAKFVSGQDTVLFLEQSPNEPGVFVLRALAASKVDLETTTKGELKAVRHLDGIAFHARAPSKEPLRVVTAQEDLGSPAVFLARVRSALKDGAK
jgi:dipeptidyl aminopeptidase/acylaminoacyl peptidase